MSPTVGRIGPYLSRGAHAVACLSAGRREFVFGLLVVPVLWLLYALTVGLTTGPVDVAVLQLAPFLVIVLRHPLRAVMGQMRWLWLYAIYIQEK